MERFGHCPTTKRRENFEIRMLFLHFSKLSEVAFVWHVNGDSAKVLFQCRFCIDNDRRIRIFSFTLFGNQFLYRFRSTGMRAAHTKKRVNHVCQLIGGNIVHRVWVFCICVLPIRKVTRHDFLLSLRRTSQPHNQCSKKCLFHCVLQSRCTNLKLLLENIFNLKTKSGCESFITPRSLIT